MNTSSPMASLAKLGLISRQKTLKVMVLGQRGVGKSALVVRFITKRYIGDYDSSLEKIYAYHTAVDNKPVCFDILDTAGTQYETDIITLEANIRWADAFVLVYSVTDKCSFDECYRLKFLINYNKRRRRLGTSFRDSYCDVPVVLVANKNDQVNDRMVTMEEGLKRSRDIGCVAFHEISTRENVEQVLPIFGDAYRFWRMLNKTPLKRLLDQAFSEPIHVHSFSSTSANTSTRTSTSSCSTSGSTSALTGPSTSACTNHHYQHFSSRPTGIFSRRWTQVEFVEEDETEVGDESESRAGSNAGDPPFRERASTDGHLTRTWKWRYPTSNTGSNQPAYYPARNERRMSISMRGNHSNY